jgi:hypothetical protein
MKLTNYTQNGYWFAVNHQTGECYCTANTIATLVKSDKVILTAKQIRYEARSLIDGVVIAPSSDNDIDNQLSVLFYNEMALIKFASKYNKELFNEFLVMGARNYIHQLIGFKLEDKQGRDTAFYFMLEKQIESLENEEIRALLMEKLKQELVQGFIEDSTEAFYPPSILQLVINLGYECGKADYEKIKIIIEGKIKEVGITVQSEQTVKTYDWIEIEPMIHEYFLEQKSIAEDVEKQLNKELGLITE